MIEIVLIGLSSPFLKLQSRKIPFQIKENVINGEEYQLKIRKLLKGWLEKNYLRFL